RGRVVPRGRGDASVELDVVAQVEAIRDVVRVLEDLGLRCVALGPIPLLLELVGELVRVLHALDVAARARVAVPVPGAADATARLDEFVASTGRRPTVLVILMDDVGWGDFGCYGGGIAVGAPTPNIDKLAREGLLLTSCYSEPSCTPTRASIMTGRLPMRHGLLIPPMYGMPGGLQGEVVLPQLLADAGYGTPAV